VTTEESAAFTVRERVPLAGYTTLGVGGPAARFVEAFTDDQVVAVVREADLSGEPVLVLGGGSNLVVADEGFPGTVVHMATRGVEVTESSDGAVMVVAAGEDWDTLVAFCVAEGLSGIECLSGIPGLAGATPIQNVGAYGQEVSETIVTVRAYDRLLDTLVEIANADCGFGYRTSAFKRRAGIGPHPAPVRAAMSPAAATGRFIVLGVTFRLARGRGSAPVRYAELARVLGVSEGARVPLAQARSAVLTLRRGKGMVLDPGDPDTRSAGSFFTNPVLDRSRLADVARKAAALSGRPAEEVSVPHFAAGDGQVKIPAAWLIERAGFAKGYAGGGGARISSKHTLALINPGGATTASLVRLARDIRNAVRETFGVELVSEPVLVGTSL
jgi:UDP-N-acetylmuramate dehydrogenase